MGKAKKYNMGGFTYGAGDGDMTPQKANMESMAKGGGLMGFTNGGGVMDNMMNKKGAGGGTGKGNARKNKPPGSRLAYDAL